MESNFYSPLFEFLVKFMWPLLVLPVLFSWIAHTFRLRKIWTYIASGILCISFPFILLNMFMVMDGAANVALVAWPIFLLPVSLVIQLISNILFSKRVSGKETTG